MKKFFGIVLILVGFFIAFLTIKGSVFFETGEGTTAGKRQVQLRDVKDLMIETSSIDIDVREASGNELTLELEGSGANKAELLSENRGNQLFVQAKHRQSFLFNFTSTKLIVYVPASYKNMVSIKTSSGDITMSGDRTFSSLQLVTSSGDVKRLAGSFADFDYRSSSGDLAALKLVTNEARFTTSSGDIFVKDFQGNVNGESSSGDAYIEFANKNGHVRWSSSSGDLVLHIPEPSYEIELSTSSGDLLISEPHESVLQQKQHLKAKVGDGDKQIIVKTSSGDVVVK
ncbi:MAG TPA: DUF4097 domain-containing protein [Bacilli bacterium]|nr:DUF4097 domain-containing protein [Bacilli bacterium]